MSRHEDRRRSAKRPNALKHGAFSETAILPGEKGSEFHELHLLVINEWCPQGATEEEAVLTIAKAIWRKRRVQRFLEVRMAMNCADPSHPSYDEVFGLLNFAAHMRAEPETAFEDYARRCLPSERVKFLRNKFPRASFNSAAEWADAIANEIYSVLVPQLKTGDPEIDQIPGLMRSAVSMWGDEFRYELALDERLDVTIDRAIKRLIQIKMAKQIFDQTLIERLHDRTKKLATT